MPSPTLQLEDRLSVQDFTGRVDSLYRLVIVAARRAAQLSKPETRPLVSISSKKPTMIALNEIIQGKVEAIAGDSDEEEILE
jgi:DNA-directed RNA polymerase subunit omega